jgi:hypothetical protein
MSTKNHIADMSRHCSTWPIAHALVESWQRHASVHGLCKQKRWDNELTDDDFGLNEIFWWDCFGHRK